MKLTILYEDNHLVAAFKPSGVLIQAGDKDKESFIDEVRQYLKEKYKKPGRVFLGLVHRLDKPVSGIVVFAKTSKGASRLSQQFRSRSVEKIYTAIVAGKIKNSGTLSHFLKKDPDKLIALISDGNREDYQKAELEYEVLKSGKENSLLRIKLGTGRFNQIRAQLAHIGHPILGDTLYGYPKRLPDSSITLCATEISFNKAVGIEKVSIKIDYQKEWDEFLN